MMISGFRREGNLIDWIRYSGSMITQAANLTEVNINGIEVEYVLRKPIHSYKKSLC